MAKMTNPEREAVRKQQGRICKAPSCDRGILIIKTGYCLSHDSKNKSYGSPTAISRIDPNTVTIDGDIAYIDLYDKKGMVKARAIIDADCIDIVKDYRWCQTSQGYVQSTIKGSNKTIRLHQLLTGRQYKMVDHINQNPLDNRLANIRPASSRQNNLNRFLRSQTGYKGVRFSGSKKNPYIVRMVINGKHCSFGLYNDIKLAAHIYNDIFEQVYGDDIAYSPLNEV